MQLRCHQPLVVAAAAAVALGCGRAPAARHPAPPVAYSTATSLVSYRMNAPGSLTCTARFRWEWEPGTLTGAEGRHTGFSMPATGFDRVEVLPTTEQGVQVCYFNHSSEGLAPGMWTITVHTIYGPEARCDVTLRAGTNVARFRQGSSTCEEGGQLAFDSPE